jgi:hypothetical protein
MKKMKIKSLGKQAFTLAFCLSISSVTGWVIALGSSVVAIQQRHKVGFIKSKVSTGEGDCGYWISGSKREKDIIFYSGYSGTLVNIDGKDLKLAKIFEKTIKTSKKSRYQITYESGIFTVKTEFTDATTDKDRKGYANRSKGTIYFSANDGWKTKLMAECAFDVGG